MAKIKNQEAYRPYKHVNTTFNIARVAEMNKTTFKSLFKGNLHPSIDLDELWEKLDKEAKKRGFKGKKSEKGSTSSKKASESKD